MLPVAATVADEGIDGKGLAGAMPRAYLAAMKGGRTSGAVLTLTMGCSGSERKDAATEVGNDDDDDICRFC